ncbi:hypothetical protein CCHR01_18310 [Colletotrichum chrysophilum]|uniref:Uncharacterized protein n=1 Tax=Colletotrichum chrysophilum TaxID=1836956 RepID=A0AAD9E919_9PEZI|nr:hypothetical protein CCHR01_18310 [Colletotrichum chrysophilum]
MSIMFVVSCLKLPLQLQSAPSPHHCNPQQRMRTARTWCLTDSRSDSGPLGLLL